MPKEWFNIIGTDRKNVDMLKIVTWQPLFGVDDQPYLGANRVLG